MNGHDALLKIIAWKDQNKQYDLDGNEEHTEEMLHGNPIMDFDQDEMQHEWAREAHSDLMDRLSFNQENR